MPRATPYEHIFTTKIFLQHTCDQRQLNAAWRGTRTRSPREPADPLVSPRSNFVELQARRTRRPGFVICVALATLRRSTRPTDSRPGSGDGFSTVGRAGVDPHRRRNATFSDAGPPTQPADGCVVMLQRAVRPAHSPADSTTPRCRQQSRRCDAGEGLRRLVDMRPPALYDVGRPGPVHGGRTYQPIIESMVLVHLATIAATIAAAADTCSNIEPLIAGNGCDDHGLNGNALITPGTGDSLSFRHGDGLRRAQRRCADWHPFHPPTGGPRTDALRAAGRRSRRMSRGLLPATSLRARSRRSGDARALGRLAARRGPRRQFSDGRPAAAIGLHSAASGSRDAASDAKTDLGFSAVRLRLPLPASVEALADGVAGALARRQGRRTPLAGSTAGLGGAGQGSRRARRTEARQSSRAQLRSAGRLAGRRQCRPVEPASYRG